MSQLKQAAFVFCAIAALPIANTAWAEDTSLRDQRATLRARQALFGEPVLADLNLCVSVRSGTALLWGNVPSAKLGKRAEELVRKVAGILQVRNELVVEASDDPIAEFLRPPSTQALKPAWLTARWGDDPAPPSVSTEAPPILLLPPLAAPPPTTLPGPSNLSAAIDRLRQADPRFHGVRVDVQGGIVRLGGVVRRGEDLMELAQAVRKLSGVERVVLQDVRSEADR